MNQVRARCRSRAWRTSTMMLAVALSAGLTSAAMSPSPSEGERSTSIELASDASSKSSKTIQLTAARVFDGEQLRTAGKIVVNDFTSPRREVNTAPE